MNTCNMGYRYMCWWFYKVIWWGIFIDYYKKVMLMHISTFICAVEVCVYIYIERERERERENAARFHLDSAIYIYI